MVSIGQLQQLFLDNKEQNLSGRYIHNEHILPLINSLNDKVEIKEIGNSVLGKPIFGIKIGTGSKRVLMWSQMHGNESTTTRALFDLLNTLLNHQTVEIDDVLKNCSLYIIPILNPDGAEAYTRFNANNIDLNRDAQDLSQPESKVLRAVFDEFKPNFCFNLHGQRTIFSAGDTNNSSTVSFLAPAQDEDRSVTDSRKVSMELIASVNQVLQQIIPNQVGVYDDSFNINCVGDTFQSLNVPTILFEAGHFQLDYQREKTREFIYYSLLTALLIISKNHLSGKNYREYFDIPENKKLLFDVLLRNASYNGKIQDIAIQFEEVLTEGKIVFKPILKKVGKLSSYFGHKELKLDQKEIKINKTGKMEVIEIVIVEKNNEFSPINLM